MMAERSLYALYRPSFGFQGTAYCIVDTPGLLLQSPPHPPSASADAPSALVVQYTTTGTNAGQCAVSTGVTKGDLPSLAASSSILGSFCSWRSCLDEAAAQGTTSHLCAAHQRLEPFLTPEERVQVLGGHSTHRGRCGDVMAPAMEIRHIKHSSSLLEELLNQQLRTTLVSFLQKMATEGSNRALLAHFSAWNPDTCSSLNASQDNDAMSLEIIAEKDMLEAIWQVERAATDEVKTLVALGMDICTLRQSE
ncbi:hypothetical protein AaE_008967 [Aphanomyces astaci]|uniref:Uncharacterized protein n=1 Tax=Aphanomyces astaci TaxID=112090 RepID=A0A6A5A977_APHAT|nr:hypothetical protein AaE_008967 [Aphanomyces astaci]